MKKVLLYTACVLGAALYFIYLLSRVSPLPFNSDSASMVLEARDILSGNVLLNGWDLTGVTFITTDMLYFIAGVIVRGVSAASSQIAIALMYFVCMMSALPLIKNKGNKIISFMIFAGIALLPSIYSLDNARVHTAMFAFLFMLMYAVERAFDSDKKRYLFIILMITALSVCGDGISLVVMTLPAAFVCLYNIAANKNQNLRKNLMILAFTTAGTAIGILMDKLFFLFGTADKRYYFNMINFKTPEMIYNDFSLYVRSVAYMMNANFSSAELLNINTLMLFWYAVVTLFGFYIIFKNISDFIKRKTRDNISVMLSLGFLFMSAILITTAFMGYLTVGRYIIYTPMLFAVLIIRFIRQNGWFDKKLFAGKLSLKIILIAVSSVMIIFTAIPKVPIGEVTQARLTRFVAEHDLTSGYGQFWDASYITAATGERTVVRPIIGTKDGICDPKWFSNRTWYGEYADFVIMRAWEVDEHELTYKNIYNIQLFPSVNYGITMKKVRDAFGEPKEKLKFENYEIWLYDYDISKKLYTSE